MCIINAALTLFPARKSLGMNQRQKIKKGLSWKLRLEFTLYRKTLLQWALQILQKYGTAGFRNCFDKSKSKRNMKQNITQAAF